MVIVILTFGENKQFRKHPRCVYLTMGKTYTAYFLKYETEKEQELYLNDDLKQISPDVPDSVVILNNPHTKKTWVIRGTYKVEMPE